MGRRKKVQPVEKNITWKVALYIRLSREDNPCEGEGNEESMSVSNQRKILIEYVENNFKGDYEIVDLYIDDGNTGTTTDRPNFQRMEQDIRDGNINCVIVKALSRAFRNIGDQSKFMDEFLPLHNVRFVSIGSPFVDSFMNPHSGFGFEVPMYGVINEQYAAIISEEVRKTFNTKRRNGEFIGAFAPYGYLKAPDNKNKLIVDETAAAVVKDIFTWFLYGKDNHDGEPPQSLSINGIAKALNELGIPSPAMHKQQSGLNFKNPKLIYKDVYWTPVYVSGMLKNQMYVGDMVQGRYKIISYKVKKSVRMPEDEWVIVENTHEPIIDRDMFELVQKRLTRDTRTPPGHNKAIYPFSGFLHCKDCGRALHRKTSKGIAYYFCRISKEAESACTRHSIRESKLEKAVLYAIRSQVSLVENLAHVIDMINKKSSIENRSHRLESLLKTHESELSRLVNICDSLYVDWKDGDISKEEYHRMKTDNQRRQNELQSAMTNVREEMAVIAKGIKASNPYFEEFVSYRNIKTLTKAVLVNLVDTIFIHEDKSITIKFNFTDQYQRILDFIETNAQNETA
jgi:DNA invertase Pin-like site-specific DNA recombinase